MRLLKIADKVSAIKDYLVTSILKISLLTSAMEYLFRLNNIVWKKIVENNNEIEFHSYFSAGSRHDTGILDRPVISIFGMLKRKNRPKEGIRI